MADPIQIGELNDVPAPNSQIDAQYHQEIANRIVHRLNALADLEAWYPTAGNGAMAYITETNMLYVRRSGVWQPLALAVPLADLTTLVATLPLGMLARTNGANVGGITTPAQEICRVSFTADPARWYRTCAFIGRFRQASSAAGVGTAEIWDASTNVICSGSHNQAAAEICVMNLEKIESGLSGTTVRRLMVSSTGSPIDILTAPAGVAPFISVEDLGAV